MQPRIFAPIRRPRGGTLADLWPEAKQYNYVIQSHRQNVERVNAELKRFACLKQQWRGAVKDLDLAFQAVAVIVELGKQAKEDTQQ